MPRPDPRLELYLLLLLCILLFLKSAGVPLPIPGDLLIVGVGAWSAQGSSVTFGLALTSLSIATAAGALVLYGVVRRVREARVKAYARRVGLTTQTVANIVREIGEQGFIVSGRDTPKGRGYPAETLAINPEGGFAIGVHDIFPELVESRHDRAFVELERRCRKRSLLVLLTNLFDDVGAEQVVGHLTNLVGRHLPLAVFLTQLTHAIGMLVLLALSSLVVGLPLLGRGELPAHRRRAQSFDARLNHRIEHRLCSPTDRRIR